MVMWGTLINTRQKNIFCGLEFTHKILSDSRLLKLTAQIAKVYHKQCILFLFCKHLVAIFDFRSLLWFSGPSNEHICPCGDAPMITNSILLLLFHGCLKELFLNKAILSHVQYICNYLNVQYIGIAMELVCRKCKEKWMLCSIILLHHYGFCLQ